MSSPNDQGTIRRTPDGNVAIRFRYGWYVVGETTETTAATDDQVAGWPVVFHPGGFFGVDDKLRRIRELADSWLEDYDVIPANDPRKPNEADIAYDDAAQQLLHILNDQTKDAWGREMYSEETL